MAAALSLLAGPALAEPPKTIGIISGPLGNPFYVSLAAGAEAGAKAAAPGARITVTSYENDLNKEFNLVENFATTGADLIILVAADPDALTPVIRKAQAAGAKVVGMDAAASAADANVVTDNFAGGKLVCSYLGEKLGGKGNVALINGPQVQGVIDRIGGCKAALAAYPGIRIVADQQGDSSRDQGFSIMQTLITRSPDIAGVFAISDPMAIGADLALRQMGRQNVTVVGFDGSAEIVEALKSNTLVGASAAQDPYGLGQLAAEIGVGLIAGRTPEAKLVKAPTGLVNRENVATYPGWRH
jgi:ribose transport system substrate-binding protein